LFLASQFEQWATHVKQTWIVTVQPVTMVPHIVKSTILAWNMAIATVTLLPVSTLTVFTFLGIYVYLCELWSKSEYKIMLCCLQLITKAS